MQYCENKWGMLKLKASQDAENKKQFATAHKSF